MRKVGCSFMLIQSQDPHHVISGIATDGRQSGSRIGMRVHAWADDLIYFFFEVAHSSFWKRQK
jgi:hypothetical protein